MKKRFLICPVPKNPCRGGRSETHDYYHTLSLSVKLHRAHSPSKIGLVSGFIDGGVSETDACACELYKMGIKDPLIYPEGLETIEQVEAMIRIAKERDERLVIVSTALHSVRVRYLARRNGVIHYTSWRGRPRLIEVPRDICMIPLAPIIDVLGLRKWYQQKVINRRKKQRL